MGIPFLSHFSQQTTFLSASMADEKLQEMGLLLRIRMVANSFHLELNHHEEGRKRRSFGRSTHSPEQNNWTDPNMWRTVLTRTYKYCTLRTFSKLFKFKNKMYVISYRQKFNILTEKTSEKTSRADNKPLQCKVSSYQKIQLRHVFYILRNIVWTISYFSFAFQTTNTSKTSRTIKFTQFDKTF